MAHSRVSSLRLTYPTNIRLSELMSRTDRTRTQIVRYALAYYLPSGMVPQAAISALTEHISLRLPADILTEVQTFANQHQVAPSDVIRCAIDAYLDQDTTHLGQGVQTYASV